MRRTRETRLFVGIQEIGDFTLRLSQGLRALGCSVTNTVIAPSNPALSREDKHDRYLHLARNKYARQLQLVGELARSAMHSDVFVFSYGRSFTGGLIDSRSRIARAIAYRDLAVLKALGKKIVVVSLGSDLRSYRLLIQEMRAAGLHQHASFAAKDLDLCKGTSDDIKRQKAWRIERYADHIFARPNSAQLLTRDYHLVWLPVDLGSLTYSVKDAEVPRVVHATTNRVIKGTKYVLEAVERLRQEGHEFTFTLCEGMSNIEVRKILSQAHIVVDQLIMPGYGLFALEAMASGCAVIGSAVPNYNGNPEHLPIMTTTPDTLYRNLKLLLGDQKLRTDMAHAGRAYVEEYHDHVSVAKRFLRGIGEGDR